VADGVDGSIDPVLDIDIDGIAVSGKATISNAAQIDKDDSGVITELLRTNRTSDTPADNDEVQIRHFAENDNDTQKEYARETITQLDVTAGTEKGQWEVSVADGVDGSVDPVLSANIDSVDAKTKFNVNVSDDSADVETGQRFVDSATPAANDIQRTGYFGRNDTAVKFEYARQEVEIINPATGSEKSNIVFKTSEAGSLTETMRINECGPIIPVGGGYQGFEFSSIADDAADSFFALCRIGFLLIGGRTSTAANVNALIIFRTGSSGINFIQIVSQSGSSLVDVLNDTTLTGTTGVNGRFTVSTQTDQNIYLENRIGSAVSVQVIPFGA